MRGYFVIVGMTLAVWQIVATRELFPILHSCEPLIVASLGVTAFFLAFGVFLGPSAEVPERRRIRPFSIVLWAAGFLPPTQLVFVHLLGGRISSFPPPLFATLLLCVASFGPLAVDAGLLVTIYGAGGAKMQGRIHEALVLMGSGVVGGGVAFAVFLSDRMSPLLAALCLSLLLFTSVLMMFARRDTPGLLLFPAILSWIAVILVIAATHSPLQRFFRSTALEAAAKQMPPAVGAQGEVEARWDEERLDVFLDGICVTPQAGAREVAHIPMLQDFMPRMVLVIGGCGPRLAGEVARHNVESLRYFHVDPTVVAMMQRYSPDRDAFRSTAVELQSPLEDVRAYVQEGQDKFDVIIIDLPVPQCAAINRLLTAEFFQGLRGVVRESGFVAVTLRCADPPSPEDADFAKSVWIAFTAAFPEYIVSAGKVRMLIGSVSGVGPTIDPRVLAGRCREKGLSVDEFGSPKLMRVDPPTSAAGANRDFQPWPYRRCYDAWVGLNRRYFALTNIVVAAAIAAVILFVAGLITGKRHVAAACAGMIFGGAAWGMLFASQLLALQAVYGTLYRQIAFTIAVLAIGLCTGLTIAAAVNTGQRRRYVALAGALGALMVVSLLHPMLLGRIACQSDAWWLTNIRITLPFLGGVGGFLLAFSFGAACTMVVAPEALFVALISVAVGIISGAILFATGVAVTSPCDVAVILSAAGASVALASMEEGHG